MVKINFAVMFYMPSQDRLEIAYELQDYLNSIPEFNCMLFGDDGTLGAAGNAERAWKELALQNDEYTHCCVLQDDVELCGDFAYGIKAVTSVKPDEVLTHCNMTKHAIEARDAGKHWIRSKSGVYGTAISMPVYKAQQMIQWCKSHLKTSWKEAVHDDSIVATWMEAENNYCYHPVPSLVQHIMPALSVAGNNNSNRINKWIVPPKYKGGSAKDYDWNVGSNNPIISSTRRTDKEYTEKYFR